MAGASQWWRAHEAEALISVNFNLKRRQCWGHPDRSPQGRLLVTFLFWAAGLAVVDCAAAEHEHRATPSNTIFAPRSVSKQVGAGRRSRCRCWNADRDCFRAFPSPFDRLLIANGAMATAARQAKPAGTRCAQKASLSALHSSGVMEGRGVAARWMSEGPLWTPNPTVVSRNGPSASRLSVNRPGRHQGHASDSAITEDSRDSRAPSTCFLAIDGRVLSALSVVMRARGPMPSRGRTACPYPLTASSLALPYPASRRTLSIALGPFSAAFRGCGSVGL